MTATTLSSREFDQDTGRAKQSTRKGPVFITDRGRPAHVLLTIEDYQKLIGGAKSLAESLEQTGVPDFEFDPLKLDWQSKPADLS